MAAFVIAAAHAITPAAHLENKDKGWNLIMLELEDAITTLLANTTETAEETCPISRSNKRIASVAVAAPMAIPPFNRSPLDGYAFMATDSVGATAENPKQLRVVTTIYAGDAYEGTIRSGEAAKIMTGAPIPVGCDCVIRQEDTNYKNDVVEIYEELTAFKNFCYAGEDINTGSTIITKNEKLNAIKVGVLASVGIAKVAVYKRVRVALLCTGSELADAGEPLAAGKIYNSNRYMIEARLKDLGAEVTVLENIVDDEEAVAAALVAVADRVDIIVTTGGVSVGERDIMPAAFEKMGATQLFWKVKIQPGTPVLAAKLRNVLLIGLSGNPFASLVNFELLVRPVIAHAAHDPSLNTTTATAIMANTFPKKTTKRRFVRAIYADGRVCLPDNHSGGSLYTMSVCNGLVEIAEGTKSLVAGDRVNVILL